MDSKHSSSTTHAMLTVAELLQYNAVHHGDRVAFASPGRTVTHCELESRTRRIANSLKRAGVDNGYVAVLLGRCVEAVESILAITRAGAIVVPIDPRCSRAELATIIDDVGPGLQGTITNCAGAKQLRSIEAAQSMAIWTIDNTPAAMNTTPFEHLLKCDDLLISIDQLPAPAPAFLHYTSGTTGSKPKGVVSSQQAWIRSTQLSMTTDLRVDSHDRIFCPIPVTHAYGFSSGIVVTLVTGCSLHLSGDRSLAQCLAEVSGITIFLGVPATYSELVSLKTIGGCLKSLRICHSGGSPPTPSLNARVEKLFGISITNHYGSTETTGAITTCRIGEPFVEGSNGTLVPGRELRIVDPETCKDVPHGAEGEIWIRSSSLLLTYHNVPGSPLTDDGFYRSGDLGHWDAKDNLMITGRLKEVIMRGGQKIHPAQIEAVLDSCDGVKESVVTAAPHDVFGEVPVAYVVPDGQPPLISTLIAACREALPNYKVPVDFFEIECVPRTRVGKPKRRTVAASPKRRLRNGVLTASAIEATILAEFSHARGLSLDTLDDPSASFDDMGMNSLVGIVVRDRLASLTGLSLPVTLLFEHTTPRSLSEHLYSQLSGARTDHTPASRPSHEPMTNREEPIAIVSMACRYPGGISSPEDLWKVVEAGIDVMSDFPTDRGWDLENLYNPDENASGTTSITRRGGFLHDMADFDAGLFGMSPREAETTDPQQRLLLETTYELLERAAIPASSLRGSDTGVWTGIMYDDYAQRWINQQHEIAAELGIGSAASVAAGRVSYNFDFRGPSMSIDTACSSSLVAIDLAVKSLRIGECSLAVAGGVTVMATPQPFQVFSKQRGLSPEGICKPYSDDADGTAWSEGVGLILLERLSDARRNGHQVLGLVRSTAVNSDGKSTTLTSPNGQQQERLVRQALQNARLSPADVDVIEGHGTGTRLGDPLEVKALLATYGQPRPQPALLGSIKSNLGHTQAAAGIAGVIKMVMAMQKGVVPATIHVTKPTRHVDWAKSNIRLVTEAQAWPETSRPRRAAVSAFGIGGTNAHIILEQGFDASSGQVVGPVGTVAGLCPWLLSGATEAALRAQAQQIGRLVHQNASDVAFSLATTRSSLRWRAAVPQQDVKALEALAEGHTHPRLQMGKTTAPRLVILFPGQGGQFPGMFKELASDVPFFAAALAEVCDAIDAHLDKPLLETLRTSATAVNRTDLTQIAIFAFQVALYRTLEHWGIVPAYLIGHSIGEITAAHVSGVLSLADAAKLVTIRGKLMASVPEGAMASLEASETEVKECLDRLETSPDSVVIAAVNSDESTVISGSEAAVGAVVEDFRKKGRRAKRLRISHACHSPAMERMVPAFLEELKTIVFAAPKIPIISTVTGQAVNPQNLCSAEYWARQVVAPVRFADAVQSAKALGGTAFLEIGPSAALAHHVEGALPTGAKVKTLIDALTSFHIRGGDVAWSKVLEHSGACKISLPTYPFQSRRYWIGPPEQHTNHGFTKDVGHPFLHHNTSIAGSQQHVFSGRISLKHHPWLGDHVMSGATILPATAFAEVTIKAGTDLGLGVIDELTLLTPLDLSLNSDVCLQMSITASESGDGSAFNIYSRPVKASLSDEWIHHASGILKPENSHDEHCSETVHWPSDGEVDISGTYDRLSEAGVAYGPAFRCVDRLWRTSEGFVARLTLPDTVALGTHLIHPALLDAAIHLPVLGSAADPVSRVPFQLAGVRFWPSKERQLRSVVRTIKDDQLSVKVFDLSGRPVAVFKTISLRAMAARSGDLYALQWSPIALTSSTSRTNRQDKVIRIHAQPNGIVPPGSIHEAVNDMLMTIQKWTSAHDRQNGQRLVVVTEKATVSDPDLTCAAIWGLMRSAQSEYQDSIKLIDIDTSTSSSEDVLEAAIASDEMLLAIQDGRILTPKLVRDKQNHNFHAVDLNGTILITGGTGALGKLLARHLVLKHGAKNVLLVSRSGPTAESKQLQAELATHGAQVIAEACDVADYKALDNLLQRTVPPATAVFHAAGVIDDAPLESLDSQRVSRVLRPKVDAAFILHKLLRHAKPFVLFSSAAGMLGNAGQANYAAGNSYLDALARARVYEGLHALSLAWGPWQSEAGMAGKIFDYGPLLPLSDQQGLELLDAALVSTEPVLVPLLIKGAVPALVKSASNVRASETGQVPWRQQLARMTASERLQRLEDLLRNEIAAVLGYDTLPDLPLPDVGLDSLAGVLIRNKVSMLAGVALPAAALFECDSVADLAKVVLDKLGDIGEAHQAHAAVISQEQQPLKDSGQQGPIPTPVKEMRLAKLCQQLSQSRNFSEAMVLLGIASMTLPTFTVSDASQHTVNPEILKPGQNSNTVIVCLPGVFAALHMTSLFRRFANAMDDDLQILGLRYPTHTVPDTTNTLAEVLLLSLAKTLPAGQKIILIGHSAGGLVAHALAHKLKARLAGLVIGDTHLIPEGVPTWLAAVPGQLFIDAGDDLESVYDDGALASVGHYLNLFKNYVPDKVAVPTLFVQASRPSPGMDEEGWQAEWPHADEKVVVEATHFSMVRDDSVEMAKAVQGWVRKLIDS